MAETKINPKEITLEDMMKYIDRMPADEKKKAKAEFKKVAFTERHHKTAVLMFDVNGNPIMKQAKDKNGKPKFDEAGKPVMYQAKKMVDVEGETFASFNLLKAQNYFVKTYMPDLLPEKKSKAKESDKLLNW